MFGTLVIAVAGGILIGLSLGALGGGGSILAVPVLVYLLAVVPQSATSASLIIVGITSLLSLPAHHRGGRVRLGQGLTFGLLGTAALTPQSTQEGSIYLHNVGLILIPWAVLAGTVLVAAVVVLVASLVPARRATQISPTTALVAV